jgi:hypothetical protein
MKHNGHSRGQPWQVDSRGKQNRLWKSWKSIKPISTLPTATTTTNYNYLWDTDSEGKVRYRFVNTSLDFYIGVHIGYESISHPVFCGDGCCTLRGGKNLRNPMGSERAGQKTLRRLAEGLKLQTPSPEQGPATPKANETMESAVSWVNVIFRLLMQAA